MSFEAFSNDDIQKILDHTVDYMPKDALDKQVKEYGSLEKYREFLRIGFTNEQAVSDLINGMVVKTRQWRRYSNLQRNKKA